MSLGDILYDVIGGISDIYVTEAALPFKRRSGIVTVRRVLLIAATIALSFVMLFALIANLGKEDKKQDSAVTPASNSVVMPEGVEMRTKPREEINLFSGSPLLIIRKHGQEDFTVITLKKYEYESLTNIGGFADAEEGADLGYEVWVCDGNGVVFSPCLKLSAGNLGYGEIFDYSPEVIISDRYADRINSIIENYYNN